MNIHSNCKVATAATTTTTDGTTTDGTPAGSDDNKHQDIQYDGILSDSFITITVQLLSDLRKYIQYQNDQLPSL